MSTIQFQTIDIVETRTVRDVGPIHCGDVLELKRGKLCLRLGDEVAWVRPNKWRITRRWRKPGPVPFSQDFYRMA